MTGPGGLLVWTGAILAIASIGVLRWSWQASRRSVSANAAGWLLMAAGEVAAAWGEGAWGVAVASLAATGAAFAILAWAALAASKPRAQREARRIAAKGDGGPDRIIGRTLTFLLTVPGAAISATIVSLAGRALVISADGGETDANVLALFAMPIAWAILMSVLPIQRRRLSQGMTLGAPIAVSALILIATGGR